MHELHQAYPDWQIDVAKEQQLIEAHDNIVLQFPIYWFSSPPLLKNGWTTCSPTAGPTVLAVAIRCRTRNWRWRSRRACAQKITRVKGVSLLAGGDLPAVEVTADYVRADYASFFAFYGKEAASDGTAEQVQQHELDSSAQGYRAFLAALN